LLSFFKFNDPIRLLGIALLLLLLRLPYIWMGTPITQPEMLWMLLGEKLSEGFMIYRDVKDNTAPLSAIIYGGLHMLFGRSIWPYHVLSAGIIFFHAAYLNHLLISHKSYEENTYLPACIMVILFHLSYDLLTLSPALMGGTFLLLAIGKLFRLASINQNNTEAILLLGIFGGLAPCFHFPLLFFLPVLLFIGLFINNFNFQELLLSMFSFFLPLSLITLYFFWIDSLMDFVQNVMQPAWRAEGVWHLSYGELLYVFFFPVMFTLLGLIFTSIGGRLFIHQQKQKQLVLIFGLFGFLLLIFNYRWIPFQFIPFVPIMAYLINHLILRNERMFVQSVFFYALLISVPFFGYSWFFYKKNDASFADYAIVTPSGTAATEGKKILVLGDDLSPYQNAYLATGYLNPRLSKEYLGNLEDLESMHHVLVQFHKDAPKLVMDDGEVFSSMLPYYPTLTYRQLRPGVFELQPGGKGN
jgi:hypothetical protein